MPNNFCSNCRKNVIVDYKVSRISEISAVDSPANDDCNYDYVRADGSVVRKQFKSSGGSSYMSPKDAAHAHLTGQATHHKEQYDNFNAIAAQHEMLAQSATQNTAGYRCNKALASKWADVAKAHLAHSRVCEKLAAEVLQSGGTWNGSPMDVDNNRHNGKADVAGDFFKDFFRPEPKLRRPGCDGGASGGL